MDVSSQIILKALLKDANLIPFFAKIEIYSYFCRAFS